MIQPAFPFLSDSFDGKHNAKGHQIEAVDKTSEALLHSDRATVVMACGTGKTLTQMWTAQSQDPSRIVVFVPTLALLKQVRDEWLGQNRWIGPLKSICVCSDENIANAGRGRRRRAQDADADETTLADLGLADLATTDPRAISAKLDELAGTPESPVVVFSTYQSADQLGAAMKLRAEGDQSFDVGIFDEAHKTVGAEGKQSAFALYDANLQIKKSTFYTATPKVIIQRKKDKEGEDKIASMNDESLYGKIVHELTTAEAVRRNLIVDYRIVISIIDDNEIEREALGRTLVDKDGRQLDARALADQIVVNRTMKDLNLQKAVLYHGTVERAESYERFANAYGAPGDAQAFSVAGYQSMDTRTQAMNDFRGPGRRTISNARVLTEGVDIPAIDLVAFMDPKKSVIDIVQAIGRAMRLANGKQFGYVLLPLHIQKGESLDTVLASQGFQKIADVLSALSANDSKLKDMFRTAMINRGKKSQEKKVGEGEGAESAEDDSTLINSSASSLNEETGGLIGVQGELGSEALKIMIAPGRLAFSSSLPYERLVQALTTRVLDSVGDGWDEMFGRLEAYKAQYGHCNVPKRKVADGAHNPYWQLGVWCSNQRKALISQKITPERENALLMIGLSFYPRDDAWQEMFIKLQDFKTQYGHCNVSAEKIVAGINNFNRQLGIWCRTQCQMERNNALTLERKEMLLKVGLSFDPLGDAWREMFIELQAFKLRYGHCNVPREKITDGLPNQYWQLAAWSSNQRTADKGNQLTPERKEKLVQVGFSFDPLNEAWREMFVELQAFKVQHGHCNVPKEKYVDGILNPHRQLGTWCGCQRKMEIKNQLVPERKEELVQAGFSFDPINEAWQKMFIELQSFKAQYGHCNVPKRKVADGAHNPYWQLGVWCSTQREMEKNNAITLERKEALLKIGLSFDSLNAAWQEMFIKLQDFKVQYGHCKVPTQKTAGGQYNQHLQLGMWCNTQRQMERNNALTLERKEALLKVGLSFDPLGDAWMDMFIELQSFKAQYGHCNVSALKVVDGQPNAYYQLGMWCGTQRKKKNNLSPGRMEALLKLGFRLSSLDTNQSHEVVSPSNPRIPKTPDELTRHIRERAQKINPGNPARPSNPASLDTFNRIGSALDDARIARDKIDDPRYRPYQKAFRENLWHVCGGQCAISGSKVVESLQAAHRGGHGTWRENNTRGWLLSSHLHQMMDANPATLEIVFNEKGEGVVKIDVKYQGEDVWKFNGKVIPMVDLEDESTWPIKQASWGQTTAPVEQPTLNLTDQPGPSVIAVKVSPISTISEVPTPASARESLVAAAAANRGRQMDAFDDPERGRMRG